MQLDYATEFRVDYYEEGCALLTVAGTDRYLVVPETVTPPAALAEGTVLIRQRPQNVYLAASSAMDLFRAIGALDCVTMTSTASENWSLPDIRAAVESEEILYVGKYSAPDYEVVLDGNCELCVESTMIYHKPQVKEQLEKLGIPVLVERSSYESHPLGRLEWLKVYGLLTGREQEAERVFRAQAEAVEALQTGEKTDKRVAFFYVTPAGAVNVRKSGDYIAKLIDMAGGVYAFPDLGEEENALSTVNLQMEAFYAGAKDADVLIYNGTVDGGIDSIAALLDKSPLFADFRAVQEGHVWCTEQNVFQQPTAVSGLLGDFRSILTGEENELTFLRHLE